MAGDKNMSNLQAWILMGVGALVLVAILAQVFCMLAMFGYALAGDYLRACFWGVAGLSLRSSGATVRQLRRAL